MKITKQQLKKLVKEQMDLTLKQIPKTFSIVVLDDGETYASGGYLVHLTKEEYEQVQEGYKVSDVINLDPDTNPNVKAIWYKQLIISGYIDAEG